MAQPSRVDGYLQQTERIVGKTYEGMPALASTSAFMA